MTIYYIYSYLGTNSSPFYIGKGSKRRAWTKHTNVERPSRENISKGNKGVKKKQIKLRDPISLETRSKISASLKGRIMSEHEKIAKRKPHGPTSEEQKKIRSEGLKRFYAQKSKQQDLLLSL
jgi:hypothetical protein